MVSRIEREKAFNTIDKNSTGVISFVEWCNHFKDWLKETNMVEDELEMMFTAYDKEGTSYGVDFREYLSFMNDVFGQSLTVAEERKRAFDTIDNNGNGVINFEEWHHHFQGMLGETNMTQEELHTMFNAYDEAGTSRGVDFKEYTSFMNDVFGRSLTVAEERKMAFDAIDINKNGAIHFKEWYQHFEGMLKGTNMDKKNLFTMFNAYDESGTSRGVDFAEYSSFMSDIFGPSLTVAEERKMAFDSIDKNNNGAISFKEWYHHFGGMLLGTNMTKEELRVMFSAYDEAGTLRGVDFSEFTSFMNDVFGAV